MGRYARNPPRSVAVVDVEPMSDDNIEALLAPPAGVDFKREDITPSVLSKSQFEALRKARANARREKKAAR